MDARLAVIVLGLVALAATFGYWTIVITEGAYFGRRLVSYLYDRGAETYDDVKELDPAEDGWFLGVPMARNLEEIRQPLVLDVATGTGRMGLGLLRQLTFDGQVVGLDVSREMLEIARQKAQRYTGRVTLIWKDATELPFASESFDAVACVEALEFLPDPTTTLTEMVRVLRPGGPFLVTNRIGWERFLMPGRAFTPRKLESMLADLGLTEVWTKPWQTYYDLIWARRPGTLANRGTPPALIEILRCPHCDHLPLDDSDRALMCPACGCRFQWNQGILDLGGQNWCIKNS
ncbi:MAG: methyltransferase domain-containing protein [Anaerolineae bacterium]